MKRRRSVEPPRAEVTEVSDRYWVAGSSAAGRLHRDALRNNQDAVAWLARGDAVALCVSDGCSALATSEVGAQLTARRAVYSAVEWAEAHPQSLASEAMDFVLDDVCAMVKRVAIAVGGANRAEEVIADMMLATMLVALATPRGVAVFGVGDGVVALGDDVRVLRAARAGVAYPAYRVHALGEAPAAQLHFVAAPEDTRLVTLATDGAEGLFASGRSPARALATEAWTRESALRGELDAMVAAVSEKANDDLTIGVLAVRPKESR
jgi:Protein phosphatase 2C